MGSTTTGIERRASASRRPMRRAFAIGVGALFVLTAACSSDREFRDTEQNAKLWGQAACSIAEAQTAQEQQDAVGQAALYSGKAVQMVPSMSTGAQQIDGLVGTLAADRAANKVASLVPDLKAIEAQASSLAKGSDGEEGAGWSSLQGSVSDCVAQLPPNLQGG
jgi:hypothetical protein